MLINWNRILSHMPIPAPLARFISRSNIRAFAPVLLFGAFLVLFFGMMSALHLNSSNATPKDAGAANELRARIFWGGSFVVLGVVTFWNLPLAAASMWDYLSRKAAGIMAVLTLLTALALGIGTRYGGSGAQDLLSKLQDNLGIRISFLTGFMNVAVATAIIFFIVSCVAIGSAPTLPLTAIDLRRRIFDLRMLLCSSAALLAAGVTEIFFLFDWPRHVPALSADPSVTLASAISAVAGALYTFLLVVIYVPIALIHERWKLELQNQLASANDSFDSDAWLKKTGLTTSTVNSFTEIAAMVSPLLASIGVPWLVVK